MAGHSTRRHRNRRATSDSLTEAPRDGRSANVRIYRLWTEADIVPQLGQAQHVDDERAMTFTISSDTSMPSTLRPVDTTLSPICELAMSMILPGPQQHVDATDLHQK
jgi:hypothetical protein